MDRRIFVLLNERLHNRALDWSMPRLTNAHKTLAFWLVVGPLLLLLLYFGSRRTRVVLLLLAILLPAANYISTDGVKPLFNRARPSALLYVHGQPETVVPGARVPPHQKPLGSSSFPSSHSTVSAALAALVILAWRRRSRWIWLALLIPLVIGYSRIYVGVHYPSDVLGGWILGAVLAWLAWRAAHKWPWLAGMLGAPHSAARSRSSAIEPGSP